MLPQWSSVCFEIPLASIKFKLEVFKTLFSERQSGKDQCDRDSAAAKRQMQYFINSDNNIDSADQMFEAMRSATALCGFTANVLDIWGQKYTKQTQIKNISKIHHVKYIYDDTKNEYHVWQFSEIGQCNKYEVKGYPVAPFCEEKMPFFDAGDSFDTIQSQRKNKIDIPCADRAYILNFSLYEKLEKHLNSGHHKFEVENQTQLSKVADKGVKRFHQSTPHSIEKQMPSLPFNMSCSTSDSKYRLKKG